MAFSDCEILKGHLCIIGLIVNVFNGVSIRLLCLCKPLLNLKSPVLISGEGGCGRTGGGVLRI
jgi:hypothetical protein